jgi:hypothetical protein
MKRSIAKGVLAGWITWVVTAAVCYNLPAWHTTDSPMSLFDDCVTFAAFPVSFGGWHFVWGPPGPPYRWMETWTFNIGSSLAIYGVLGALAGAVRSLIRGRTTA